MATLIGLSIRVKLLRSLPPRFKVDIAISPGTHNQEKAGQCCVFHFIFIEVYTISVPLVNKQLNDKERVAAALENENLLNVVNKCLEC